jgi:hypothetical protein
MALPYFIGHLGDCEGLLVVSSIVAAFIPLAEFQTRRPPGYSPKADLFGKFLVVGPLLGGVLALSAILLSLVYTWLPNSITQQCFWGYCMLGTPLGLLCLSVLLFFSVAAVAVVFALKPPSFETVRKLGDSDLERLRQAESPPSDGQQVTRK